MLLQPSLARNSLEQRQLFAWELTWGGHGQIPLTGAGCYTPTSTAYSFYAIEFLTESIIESVAFRAYYQADNGAYVGQVFPAGYTWTAPISSICLSGGSAIAYQYLINNVDSVNIGCGC